MSRIAFDHVSVQFGGLKVVDDVSFSIADREFVSVIGPSGCRYSTTARIEYHARSPKAVIGSWVWSNRMLLRSANGK